MQIISTLTIGNQKQQNSHKPQAFWLKIASQLKRHVVYNLQTKNSWVDNPLQHNTKQYQQQFSDWWLEATQCNWRMYPCKASTWHGADKLIVKTKQNRFLCFNCQMHACICADIGVCVCAHVHARMHVVYVWEASNWKQYCVSNW